MSSLSRVDYAFIGAYIIGFSALFIQSLNHFFFWDTIQLASKHASFFFDHNFAHLILPNDMDSGHIPTFGAYLAVHWKLFGRTLPVSHLSMIPFYLLSLAISLRFIRATTATPFIGVGAVLLLTDPALLSQFMLVSPDIWMVAFTLLTAMGVYKNKRLLIASGVFLLFLTSMRGMMLSFSLLIADIILNIHFDTLKKTFLKLLERSLLYLPAFILFLVFNSIHYEAVGWIGYHADSPWADSFARVDLAGFLKNCVVFIFYISDFGRVFLFGLLLILLYKNRKKITAHSSLYKLTIIFICVFFILPINMLWAQELVGHRYLLPINVLAVVLVIALVNESDFSHQIKWATLSICLVAQLLGNFIIYPEKMAQGWDSTLAHLPYYELRNEAKEYLREEQISPDRVGSFFPNLSTFDYTDLNGGDEAYTKFSGTNEYLVYSNVFNIPDDDIDLIYSKYEVLKVFENKRIWVKVLKRKEALE